MNEFSYFVDPVKRNLHVPFITVKSLLEIDLEIESFSIKILITDQEDVVKEIVKNNPEILNKWIDADLPIHFAIKHSTPLRFLLLKIVEFCNELSSKNSFYR